MESKLDDIEIIKFFESGIGKLKNSPNRELWLNDFQEYFQIIESDLSPETKNYLDKIIKDSLKK